LDDRKSLLAGDGEDGRCSAGRYGCTERGKKCGLRTMAKCGLVTRKSADSDDGKRQADGNSEVGSG
jgi:hypothetical protein